MKKIIFAALAVLAFVMAIPADADAHRRWWRGGGYGYYAQPYPYYQTYPAYNYYPPPSYYYPQPYYNYGGGYGYQGGGVRVYVGPNGGVGVGVGGGW